MLVFDHLLAPKHENISLWGFVYEIIVCFVHSQILTLQAVTPPVDSVCEFVMSVSVTDSQLKIYFLKLDLSAGDFLFQR